MEQNHHCVLCEGKIADGVKIESWKKGNAHSTCADHERHKQTQALKKHFGYFESPFSETPEHDPGKSAPCLICHKPWDSENVKTISLMLDEDSKSYFYRVHKSCYEGLSDEEAMELDSSLIDNLPAVMHEEYHSPR